MAGEKFKRMQHEQEVVRGSVLPFPRITHHPPLPTPNVPERPHHHHLLPSQPLPQAGVHWCLTEITNNDHPPFSQLDGEEDDAAER